MNSSPEIAAPSSGALNARSERPPPLLLHNFASCLIVLMHSCFENMTHLPFPIGTILKNVEKLVDPWTHPLVEASERLALRILAAVDGQIYATSGSIKGCIFCTSARLKSVTSILSRRGLIGMSADFWVKNEAVLKERLQTAIDFAHKYPLLRLITHVLGNLSSPLATAISDWLVKQSEVQEKSIQSATEDSVTHGKSLDPETNATELILRKIEDAFFKEHFIESAEKGLISQNASLKKEFIASAGKEIDELEKNQDHDELANPQHQKDDPPDVLELIDSGWLLGSAALTPRSSSGASSSKLRRRFFD